VSTADNRIKSLRLILALQEGGHTNEDLAEESGFSIANTRRWTYTLHKRRYVHISSWVGTAAVWSWGNAKDARRPKRTRAEIVQSYRERRKVARLVRAHAILTNGLL
jgi:DNA-binding IclR family transcriptional regulator